MDCFLIQPAELMAFKRISVDKHVLSCYIPRMISRAALKAEIDSLQEQDLDIVHSLLQSIIRQYDATRKETFMAKLKRIQIDAPPDFSQNIERYLKQQGNRAEMLTELSASSSARDIA